MTSDDKFYTIDKAEMRYDALMALLSQNCPDPYAAMPAVVRQAVRRFEKIACWSTSISLISSLEDNRDGFGFEGEQKARLEEILELRPTE